jgi:hypothetical protein
MSRELRDELRGIVDNPENFSVEKLNSKPATSSKRGRYGFVITAGNMYDAPDMNFTILKAIGEFFGTDEVDVDDYSFGGCESCDYGSDYGHEIQVYNPTKNLDILD